MSRILDTTSLEEVAVTGFENVVLNDLLSSSEWHPKRCWSWRKKSHINVLEAWTSVAALEHSGTQHPDSRVVLAIDSNVARFALSKGRSSSFALQPVLKRSGAIQLAYGLFPAWCFAPTRLNVADDPTRDAELREPCSHSFEGRLRLRDLCELQKAGLKRFAANWVRLVILVSLFSVSDACCDETFFQELSSQSEVLTDTGIRFSIRVFDCFWNFWTFFARFGGFVWIFSLGWILLLIVCCHCLTFRVRHVNQCLGVPLGGRSLSFFIFASCSHFAFGAMGPSNAAEHERALARSHVQLAADRVLKKQTRDRRYTLINNFRQWLWTEHGVSFRCLMQERPLDGEKISNWLVAYGRAMFNSGKAYGQYSETINGISMLRPALKKQLVSAWDLAYAWVADEPYQHHPALPISVMMSMVVIAILWGWPYEAAVISLTWAGVLRIGEVLQATRSDLILPQDSAPGNGFLLLRIKDPKTRGRSARHQSARVDQEDLVAFLSAVYGPIGDGELLWPHSASTLRKRFADLLRALGLPTEKKGQNRPFDLGSLRPGGATWILNMTENSELVRRRGRWMSHRVMEVYLQEVQVATYLNKLSPFQRDRILMFASGFSSVVQEAIQLLKAAVPPSTWYSLLRSQPL